MTIAAALRGRMGAHASPLTRLSAGLLAVERRAETALSDRRAWGGAIALLLTLQLALIFTHRPWLDEWQALLIAQQSPTLTDLMANLRYEGHPPLWYLLLRAVALVVPIFWVLPATAAAMAVPTQLAILLRAPFTRLQRLMIAAGYFMLFDYLTMSRSLTMGVMCLVLFMAMRDRRGSWLWIALLPMCDFLFGVLSIVLVAMQWRAKQLWAPGLALWMVSGAAAAFLVIPAADVVPAMETVHPLAGLWDYLNRLSALLLPIQFVEGRFMWNGGWPAGLGAVGGPLFLFFLWRQVRDDRFDRFAMGGFVALTIVFSCFAYPLHTRHLSLIALLLILLKWSGAGQGAGLSPPMRLWLAGTAICGLAMGGYNLVVPFNNGHVAAREIVSRGLQDKHWIVFKESPGPELSAMTGMEFRGLQRDCTQSFIRWNHRATVDDWPQLEAYLRAQAEQYGRIYLLTHFPVRLSSDLVQPISHIPGGWDGQSYYLSVIGPDRPESARRPPPCAGPRRALDQGTIWPR